ncbi:MAG: hypothetical protein KIG19_01010, partial [Bacteroidales bacterium]|nr:hypothetical protein [Bacteroidales bacterium]
MKYTLATKATALLLLAASCTQTPLPVPERGPVTVGFGVGSTKVSIDAGSAILDWEEGDALSVWAEDSQGGTALDASTFRLAACNGPMAYFTAQLPSPMPEDSYIYRCLYPQAQTLENGLACYTVGTQQYQGSEPCVLWGQASHGALTAIEPSLPVDDAALMQLRMSSLLHYLRFFIPEGSDLLGEPVQKIKFTMPQRVAGTIKVDPDSGTISQIDSPVSEIVLDELSLTEGSYALAAIIPPGQAYTEGQTMSITLYGSDKFATIEPLVLTGRDFKAGHMTSVAMRANQLHDFYRLRFNYESNLLGEDLQSITLSLEDGSNWPETDSPKLIFANRDGSTLSVGQSLDIAFENKDNYLFLNGKNILVTYESDNALIQKSVTLSIDAASLSSTSSLACPYLFSEDFSNASIGFNTNNGDHSASGDYKDTIEGTDYGLPGWTANQAAVLEESGNKAMAIRHLNEIFGLQGTYRGRVDSAPLAHIKKGKSVKVRVSFNYTGYSKERTPQISYGWDTTQGAVVGYYQAGSALIKGGALIANLAGDKVSAPKNGSVANPNEAASFEIPDCTSLTRLAWDCYGANSGTGTTKEWIFIDNII